MVDPFSQLASLERLAAENVSLKWYAIADSAQDQSLPSAVTEPGRAVRCLLGAEQLSPVAKHSPHLVELPQLSRHSQAWRWISRHAKSRPTISVIATDVRFDQLFDHLAQLTLVELPDRDEMFFAFWDPAILGSLVGQADDTTLYVPGPVLDRLQIALLERAVSHWWYWDRQGILHSIEVVEHNNADLDSSLVLKQCQVDQLVEASVPDHVLYYLELNQPLLFEIIVPHARYDFVKTSLRRANEFGLKSMKDLVNFVCAELIYGDAIWSDKSLKDKISGIRSGKVKFDDVLAALS